MNYFKNISASDIRNALSDSVYSNGRIDFEQHKVIRVHATIETEERLLLSSCVNGNQGQRYNQNIYLTWANQRLNIRGGCNCGATFNCQHVAAACLAYIKTKSQQNTTPNPAYLDWLSNLDEVSHTVNTSKDFVAYVLNQREFGEKEYFLSMLMTREKKKGGLTVGRIISIYDLRYGYYGYLSRENFTPEDQELFRLVHGLKENDYDSSSLLEGALGHLVLSKAVQSGRLFWKSHQFSSPLRTGKTRTLEISWQKQNNGDYKLEAAVANDARLIPTEPPLYLDEEMNQLGPVDCANLTRHQLQKILTAPTVPAEYVTDFSQRLVIEHPTVPVPPPEPIAITELSGLPVRPRLQLLGQQLDDTHYIHLLMLRFDYDSHTISALPPNAISVIKADQGYIKIQRNLTDENAAIALLHEFGFSPFELEHAKELFFYSAAEKSVIDSATRWSHFLDEKIPELEQQGWIIDIDDSFLLQFEQPDNWDAEIEPSGNDWFAMHFNITINNQSLPLLPLITPVLENYERNELPEMLSIPLEQHQYVNIPSDQLKPFLDILYELFDSVVFDDDGNGRISRYNAAAIAELEQHSYGLFSIKGGQELIETGKKIRNFQGIANTAPPRAINTQLREYQQKGLNWLQFLREYRFGGILADDMGLGKTIQTLAHLLLEKESGRMDKPCLIIAPTSLMSNWRREAQRFTPDLSVLVLQGSDRKQRFDEIMNHDLILSTYPLLHRDESQLVANRYYYLILDEAQVLKNPKAQAARVARRIDAQYRLCLTGTPMENHLGELWAQYDFLMPGFLGDQTQFKKLFRTPIEIHGSAEIKERLSKRLKPFMLRRSKRDVASELPEKTEMIRSVPLYEKQAALYESIRVSMEKKVRDAIAEKGLARSQITILDALLKLRQTCCDPRTLNLKEAHKFKQSAKLDLLMEMLPELLEEGRRILIFSQFTKMLGLIETELKNQNMRYSKLTGQTQKRDAAIELFKNGHADIFLISLKAGGVGLNLTEADTVIIYDPWWNPAAETQAADRAHRIGQDKAVFVYKLITENTVEEKILAMQEKKRKLAESIYQGGNKEQALQLTAEELTDLFKPTSD